MLTQMKYIVHQVLASHFVMSFSMSTVNRNKARYEIGVISQQMADSKHFFHKSFHHTVNTIFSQWQTLLLCCRYCSSPACL